MIVVKHYSMYNQRRYSSPWIAKVDTKGWPDFSTSIGEYTGDYRNGREGDLVIHTPEEGAFYMYGQKDYRKPQYSEKRYVRYINGELIPFTRAEMVAVLYHTNI